MGKLSWRWQIKNYIVGSMLHLSVWLLRKAGSHLQDYQRDIIEGVLKHMWDQGLETRAIDGSEFPE